jgi:tetratricopeptide (TPR) repeat protein
MVYNLFRLKLNNMQTTKKLRLLILFSLFICKLGYAQTYSPVLLKGDKLFIKKAYHRAVTYYEKYLIKYPKDFYASRQAAICYTKIKNPNMAIDYWPAVIENSQANDKDRFGYAKCLIENSRKEEAEKVFITLINSSNKLIADSAAVYLKLK